MKKIFLFSLFMLVSVNYCSSQFLQWALSEGGLKSDGPSNMTVDGFGNVYIIGSFDSVVDFNPGSGIYNLTSVAGYNSFIQKLDSAGNLIWVKQLGNPFSSTVCRTICLDKTGNIYITGTFWYTADLDPGPGVYNLTSTRYGDIFFLKLDSLGNFVWAERIGGMGDDITRSAVLDDVANWYITGFYQDTVDFDPGLGVFNLNGLSATMYILKLDSAGNFVWVRGLEPAPFLGSHGWSIALDNIGNVIATGNFGSTIDFDPDSSGVFILTPAAGYGDIFIWKLDTSGNFVWAKSMGGTETDYGLSIVTDNSGNIYSAGTFADSVDFDPGLGIFYLTATHGIGSYIQKLDANGNLVWVKGIISDSSVSIEAMAIDKFRNIYSVGNFTGTTDFDPNSGIYDITATYTIPNGRELFVQKLDASGNLVWIESLAVTGPQWCKAALVDTFSNVYVTGTFAGSVDFDPDSLQTYNLASVGGDRDIFILKWGQNNSGYSNCADIALVIDSTENITCGNPTGFASAVIFNGTSPYTYSWNTVPVTNTPTVSFSSPGIYTLQITDSIGCSRASYVLINAPYSTNGFDLKVNFHAGMRFRRGDTATLRIDAFNDGCAATTGQLMLILDSLVSYYNALPAPDYISGDTLFWAFNNLIYDSGHLQPVVYLIANLNAPFNSSSCLKSIITPVAGDAVPSNNAHAACIPIRNAWDPNDIQVHPLGVCNVGFVLDTQQLTYTVRFQNTGNAEAVNVFILDTLNSGLDINTVRIIGKSHEPLITEVLPGNVLKFRFDNINLPDSFTSQIESQGYVIFEVKPVVSILNNTIVTNRVGIYFDFNEAVITNTVSNTFVHSIPAYNTSLNISACHSYVLNNQTYDTTGTYTQYLISTDGCDSAVTLNLIINSLDTSIVQSINTLTSVVIGGAYEWFNCDNGIPINGETNQSFTARSNGNYAVIVTQNNCIDTSSCYNVQLVGFEVNQSERNQIMVYPNPSEGLFYIKIYNKIRHTYIITDAKGATIFLGKIGSKESVIDLSAFEAGLYFLKIDGHVLKLIRQ